MSNISLTITKRIVKLYKTYANPFSAIWNANKIQGVDVDPATPGTGEILVLVGGKWVPSDASGGAPHTLESHLVVTATGAQLNILVAGGDTNLHSHAGQAFLILPTELSGSDDWTPAGGKYTHDIVHGLANIIMSVRADILGSGIPADITEIGVESTDDSVGGTRTITVGYKPLGNTIVNIIGWGTP